MIEQKLSVEELQNIFVFPKVLDFGRIYIESVAIRSFSIKNNNLKSIIVNLQTLGQELKQTDETP